MSYDEFHDDDTAEQPWDSRPPKRRFGVFFLVAGLVVVLLVGIGGVAWLAKGGGRDPVSAQPKAQSSRYESVEPGPSPTQDAAPSEMPSSAPPSQSKSPKPSATKKSLAPPKETALPPPPPKVTTPAGCKPTYKGTQLPKSEVRTYLDAAAEKQFWGSRMPAEVQAIRVPARLLYGIAEQESGWQSNIYACDKGVGVMQVMPDTETWMNQRFGTSWKIDTPKDNVMLGAQYLAWAIYHFGLQLGTYDITGNVTLRDAVISAYNNGAAAVDLSKGNAGITNWNYVNNVVPLMGRCCNNY